MSSSTALHLPLTFPFPIKITSIDVATSTSLERGTRLLSYSFVHVPSSPGAQPETRFGTWDSSLEGSVENWLLKTGDVVSERKAREKPALYVTEPCKHGVQIGGLCGLCGKDMTDYDYTGFSDASRASIQMTHSAFGPTVSLEEAQKLERATADHLLKSRKLSLIVDLDQTIVHATVDPTVGEWISEGEAWEAKQTRKRASGPSNSSDSSDDSSSDSEDECNPNWEALKDVKKFKLGPEALMAPSRSVQKSKLKGKAIETDGCMYYIKPRPGLKEFLSSIATKYEMHVYTMGTRAYAEEVCNAIDPGGKIFGGRILSRDESGSLTQKSLQRLFPCDTSMVVIIDDRADVWEWSPNLVKVIPYDFFVGIGDINSTFLPKVEPLAPPGLSGALEKKDLQQPGQLAPFGQVNSTTTKFTTDAPGLPSTPEETERAELVSKALITQNALALEKQLEQRPLAKKQEELQESAADEPNSETPNRQGSPPEPEASKPEQTPRKALLKNDDVELARISKVLNDVHSSFFRFYDARLPKSSTQKRKPEPPGFSKAPYDVTSIIPRIRSRTLEGVHILFSSVIPLDMRPESTEIWKMANMFGAQCSTELVNGVTHVVAAKRGTMKVDAARKKGSIKVVWLSWFTDSVALWKRQDETPYLLDEPPSVSAPTSHSPPDANHQISSDPEPESDDWDQPAPPKEPHVSLALDDINWDDINDEVDAAMNESDDDDDEVSEMRSIHASEDEELLSANNTPFPRLKRLRSITPSESGLNGSSDPDALRSPLSKRKKLAADRTGYSRLKEGITAEELGKRDDGGSKNGHVATPSPVGSVKGELRSEGEESEEDEDDFLARELEEEWG